MKKLLYLYLFLTYPIFITADTVKVYFWNVGTEVDLIKWVKLDLKKTSGASVSDKKIKNSSGDFAPNKIYSISINRNGDGKDNLYINGIEIKYNVRGVGKTDKTYRFDRKISLADEELVSILLYPRSDIKKLGVYKRYRGRIRADLRRYRKKGTTSLRDIFGEDSTVDNISTFPINLDSMIGKSKYRARIHTGRKD